MNLVKQFIKYIPIEGKINFTPQYANFRCPVCGDSHIDKSKKRAYILKGVGDKIPTFFCHNEGCHELYPSFYQLLKEYSPQHANEYLSMKQGYKLRSLVKNREEQLNELQKAVINVKTKPKKKEEKEKPFFKDETFRLRYDLKEFYLGFEDIPIKVQKELPQVALNYLSSRGIEPNDSMMWSPDKTSILFLFRDPSQTKNIFGYQRRSVLEKRFKISLYSNHFPKLYDPSPDKRNRKRVYLVESVFNALSLSLNDEEDVISIMGTHLTLEQHEYILKKHGRDVEIVFALDNDEAGKKKIKQMITINRKNKFAKNYLNWSEWKYVSYPSWWKEGIDINDVLRLNLLTKEQITQTLRDNAVTKAKAIIAIR